MINNGPIDFLILAPLELEIRALCKEFGLNEESYEILSSMECYATIVNDVDDENKATNVGDKNRRKNIRGKRKNIRIVKLPYMGVMRAAVNATKLIAEWRPACVVSFGIAGRVSNEVKIGEVLVAKDIIYYEPAKESVSGSSEKGKTKTNEPAPDYFTADDFKDICLKVKKSLKKEWFKNHEAILASGEKKIADTESPSRELICDLHRRTHALDMEAAGVAAAVDGIRTDLQPKLLVVKGISDDASKAESKDGQQENQERDDNRRIAAERAAQVLHCIIKKWELSHLAKSNTPIQEVRKITDHLINNACPECLIESKAVSRLEWVRILRDKELLPSVYYHWRILHEHIHWLDYCYLLVLRHFQDLDITVHLLIDDELETPESWRKQTLKVIDAVLAGKARAMFSTTMEDEQIIHTAYSDWVGLDVKAKKAYKRATGDHLERDRFDGFWPWLLYISWSASITKRCILLPWDQHAKRYEQIKHNLFLDTLIVTRPTLTLNGTQGKKQKPGERLVIDAPKYKSILEWLETEKEAKFIEDLAKYLSLGNPQPIGTLSDEATKLLEPWPQLKNRLESKADVNFCNSVHVLLERMAEWNRAFFNGWSSE